MTNKQRPKQTNASAQAYLDIEEIKEGVVILKDGSMRAVVLVSSINFDLKSEEERDAIIVSFQSFLNSLTFPVQIVVHSKKIDLDDYIRKLKEIEKGQTTQLLKIQVNEYINYVQGLLEEVNIMDKSFFAVIPFYPNVIEKSGFLFKFSNILNLNKAPENTSDFENDKVQLMDRVDIVVSGLKSVGLNCASLDTQNLIQLYYSLYNPDSSRAQKLRDIPNLTAEVVKKGKGEPEQIEI